MYLALFATYDRILSLLLLLCTSSTLVPKGLCALSVYKHSRLAVKHVFLLVSTLWRSHDFTRLNYLSILCSRLSPPSFLHAELELRELLEEYFELEMLIDEKCGFLFFNQEKYSLKIFNNGSL